MEVIAVLVSLAGFLAIAGLVLGVARRPDEHRRDVRERFGRYTQVGTVRGFVPTSGEASNVLKEERPSHVAGLDRLLAGSSWAERQAVTLAQAAIPLRVGEYLLIRWVSALCLALLIAGSNVFWPVALFGGAVGFIVPGLYVGRRKAKRLRAFDDQLVDALTMMANGLRGGSSFLQAMELIARELPSPTADEFGQTVAEISVGSSIEDALAHLARRVPSYDLYLAVTAIAIQRSVGGNLSEVLSNIAHTIRERVYIMRDLRAKTGEQRLSAYLLGALPLFLLVVILIMNPTYMAPMIETPLGLTILGVGFGLQALGFVVMRKLATIEV